MNLAQRSALLSLAAIAALPCVASAAFISYSSGTYTENFNALGTSGTTTSALAGNGWYAGPLNVSTGSDSTANIGAAFNPINPQTVTVDNGSTLQVSPTPRTFNYGTTGAADRALGLAPIAADAAIEARFQNNTGAAITKLAITFDGEQWRRSSTTVGSGTPDRLLMAYSLNGTTWNQASLTFTVPNNTGVGGSGTALDGNAAANRTANISGTIGGLAIANGANFFLRWVDGDQSGTEHGKAIDNFAMTATTGVPLPAPIIVNQQAGSLAYSPLNNSLYVSIPGSSATSPNTLRPINPATGALGTAIPIGPITDQMVASDDGKYLYVKFNDHYVQRYNVATQSADLLMTMPGSGQFFESVGGLSAIPGQPDAVLISRRLPNFSPSATGTGIWKNGVELPDQIGHGLGVGGPDVTAVNETGTQAFGYTPSLSNFFSETMVIDANGIHGAGGNALNGVLSGSVGRIALAQGKLFVGRGDVFDVANRVLLGSFEGGGNFFLEPSLNRLYSITSLGTTHTLHVYTMDSLIEVGSQAISGIAGTTSGLTRFGGDGFAFYTSNNQVVIFHSNLVPVPEPSTILFASLGLAGLVIASRRRKSMVGPKPNEFAAGRRSAE